MKKKFNEFTANFYWRYGKFWILAALLSIFLEVISPWFALIPFAMIVVWLVLVLYYLKKVYPFEK